MNINFTSRKTFFLIIILFFAFLYSIISLVNHYQFRTEALDLGMMNHAIYNFAHFSQNYFLLDINGNEVNYFGDHFSPITIFYAPFYYLFGSYTLLIIQIAAIIFGGIGVYKYSLLYLNKKYLPLLILIHFFCIWGIYSALSFDFHNNVVAAMLVPWLIYFYEKRQLKMILLFTFLILICKENMALWLVFIYAGLIIKNKGKKIKNLLRLEIPLLVFCFIYFVLIVGVLMPIINNGEGFSQLSRYSHLGSSLLEIIMSIIDKPSYVFSLFFESPLSNEALFGIKSELHYFVLISGGFALLLRPSFLIMLLPIYAQKLLTNDVGFWGVNLQYSIEFAPIISLALIHLIKDIHLNKISYLLITVTVLTTSYHSYQVMERRKMNTAFYSSEHYNSNFINIKEIKSKLREIPKNAPICVSSSIAPHLAFRDKIYLFPHVKDSNYIILFSANRSPYPMSNQEYKIKIKRYINSDEFKVIYNKNDLLILKKRSLIQ
jgi:uncharacterized membrane protein